MFRRPLPSDVTQCFLSRPGFFQDLGGGEGGGRGGDGRPGEGKVSAAGSCWDTSFRLRALGSIHLREKVFEGNGKGRISMPGTCGVRP
jgi:hypothetical protein